MDTANFPGVCRELQALSHPLLTQPLLTQPSLGSLARIHTWDYHGIFLVRVADLYTLNNGILVSRDTWDYPGMFLALAME